MCDKWINLSGRSRYSSMHCFQHKKECLLQNANAEKPLKKRPTLSMASLESTPEARRDALKLDASRKSR
ncbi:hypothetical protein BU17DRAFT_87609 [Hysterangium stoloniferum]|nr:hypothetical protein BU17DRAFT_87609 [Hysterangium stoloniferum]